MNQELSTTQKIKAMLELPDKGPLKSYIQYCQAGEILDKPIVTESDLLLALKNADHELLDFFKTSFFYSWDEANGENFNFKTTPLTNERRQEIYEILNINEELRKIFSENIKIAQSNNDQIFVNENQTPSWVDTDNWYYWSKYKDYLLNKYGPEEGLNIVRSIDDSSTKILNLLQDPTLDEISQRKGLVVGYVQSGKTSNMQALIAKAIDSGYKLIILLGGDKNNLRKQTQRRFDKEIFGKELVLINREFDSNNNYIRNPKDEYYDSDDFDEFVSYGGSPRKVANKPNIVRLTTSKKNINDSTFQQIIFQQGDSRFNTKENLKENDAYVAIVTKNRAQIDKVTAQINILRNMGTNIDQVPALIIDDESDSSSVSTHKIGEPKRAVNNAIVQLLKKLKKSQYVGYTATPYANVFIDPEDDEDLFPSNFINILDRPANYMGASDFLSGYTSSTNPYITQFHSDNEETKLLEAIDAYILSGAIKLFREFKYNLPKFSHHTMLIHTSTLKDEHEKDKQRVIKLLKHSCDYSGIKGKNRLRDLYEQDFLKKTQGFEKVSFEELIPYIDKTNSKLTGASGKPEDAILKVNGAPDGDDPDFSTGPVWKILVGGAKLSRGYTVEGLTISFFTRATGASDTLMQMGRWFGFRKNYKDLVRLYITMEGGPRGNRDILDDFIQACQQEEDFRTNIKINLNKTADEIVESNITPLTFKKFVRFDKGLMPTSPGKRRIQKSQIENHGGMKREIEWYPRISEKNKIKTNLEIGNKLFTKYPLSPIGGPLVLDFKNVNNLDRNYKDLGPGKFDGFTSLITNTEDFVEFLKEYKWQKGKEFINSPIINFLESKFIAKRPEEVDIEIDQWRIFFPQLIESEDNEKYPFAGIDLDVFQRKRDLDSNHKSYSPTSGGEVHTLISSWLAVGHENKGDKSYYGVPNKLLKSMQQPRTSYALFYLMRDKNLDNEVDIPTLGYRLHFNDNSMPRGSYFARDEAINAQLRAEFESVN